MNTAIITKITSQHRYAPCEWR